MGSAKTGSLNVFGPNNPNNFFFCSIISSSRLDNDDDDDDGVVVDFVDNNILLLSVVATLLYGEIACLATNASPLPNKRLATTSTVPHD